MPTTRRSKTTTITVFLLPSCICPTLAFTLPHYLGRTSVGANSQFANKLLQSRLRSASSFSSAVRLWSNRNDSNDVSPTASDLLAQKFDQFLEEGNLGAAEELLRTNSNESKSIVSLENRERWNKVFDAIEFQTAQAEETMEVNTRRIAEFPLISQARNEMNNMYNTLRDLNQLQLFGAISSKTPPAAGSHAVRPTLLEEISGLPMKALTPKPTNTLLIAGVAVAVLEGILSVALNINLNILVLSTLAGVTADRVFLNGAILETFYKLLNPGIQDKIQRHEAGHFLCAYLLGCPVEGCVLNAWAALQDSRFGMGRQVTAGTSFFDPALSDQINSPLRQVTRSSIDRYSIIVMAGIAAEAIHYGQADGGAGDEMALIAFLSQLNGASSSSSVPAWNNITIRNQARWGALQAVLILREYKACYEALVDALEKGGSLGDCIYAIEKAARDNGLGPSREPVGYIIEQPGDVEEWRTEKPKTLIPDQPAVAAARDMATTGATSSATINGSNGDFDPKESMVKLAEYRKSMEDKLKAIDEKLDSYKES